MDITNIGKKLVVDVITTCSSVTQKQFDQEYPDIQSSTWKFNCLSDFPSSSIPGLPEIAAPTCSCKSDKVVLLVTERECRNCKH